MTVQETKKQYQLTQWTQMIQDYRSSGQSVANWCREQGMRPQTYYYRLRKVREAACQIMPSKQETEFVPVTFAASAQGASKIQTACIQSGDISISLSNDASAELIQNILKACRYAG